VDQVGFIYKVKSHRFIVDLLVQNGVEGAWRCVQFLCLTSSLNVAEHSERVLSSRRLIQFLAAQPVSRKFFTSTQYVP